MLLGRLLEHDPRNVLFRERARPMRQSLECLADPLFPAPVQRAHLVDVQNLPLPVADFGGDAPRLKIGRRAQMHSRHPVDSLLLQSPVVDSRFMPGAFVLYIGCVSLALHPQCR